MFKRLVLAATLAAASAVATAAPVTYKIDPNHTDVIASWSHFGFSKPVAHFGAVDGTIVHDADNVGTSSVNVVIPLSGLNSHVEAFDEHLRSADFFEAEKYPDIRFRSTKVEAAGDNKLRVIGDLSVKGITKPAVLDVTLNKQGEHPMAKRPAIGFDATTTLKRSDFGVGKYAPNVSDEVEIRITTEALVPKAEAADAKPQPKAKNAKS
ncbi:YceI family protein [Cognatilysobacter bugurensis]|uniref:Polyisoprenoid-binding protein n=1 Tax=Cognatilysobacter bugurensis TaxID=543356 RepID=A0A918W8I2_9GAMM|nr:YceI family protein [Lysobacter bugurensis]GHA80990.1 polyisoprenoid-binding protein [Lysobacter bugurensis]